MNEIITNSDINKLSNIVNIYENSKKEINKYITSIFNNYLKIGKLLNDVKESNAFVCADYENIYDFAKNEFDLSSTTVKNLIAIFKRFCKCDQYGNVTLLDDFKDFNYSQLVELVSVDNSQIELFKPEMSVKTIRVNKLKIKLENDFNSLCDKDFNFFKNYISSKFNSSDIFNLKIDESRGENGFSRYITVSFQTNVFDTPYHNKFSFYIYYNLSNCYISRDLKLFSINNRDCLNGLSYCNSFTDDFSCINLINKLYENLLNVISAKKNEINLQEKNNSKNVIDIEDDEAYDFESIENIKDQYEIIDFNTFIDNLKSLECEFAGVSENSNRSPFLLSSDLFLRLSNEFDFDNFNFIIQRYNMFENFVTIIPSTDSNYISSIDIIYGKNNDYLNIINNFKYNDESISRVFSKEEILCRGFLNILMSDVGLITR